MKICIGIISYLPDDKELRNIRIDRLNKTILDCNRLFNLSILIIAQNWNDFTLDYDNVIPFYYDKLGITGARKELRNKFINSDFDYLIMLDDDAKLVGTRSDASLYLDQIENHPGKWYGVYKSQLLKLFAISKDMFREVDYPEGEAEHGDFFEDMYLIMLLNKLYPRNKFLFTRNTLNDISDSANDPNSTWYHKQFNKHDIGDRTRAMIKEL